MGVSPHIADFRAAGAKPAKKQVKVLCRRTKMISTQQRAVDAL
jgi:hypothetical protein